MHQFFKSTFFNFETIRIVGTAPFGGADIAEALDAIGQIRDKDPLSWHSAWTEAAERAERIGEEASAAGNRDEARRAFLRCSNYWRASGYMFNNRPQSPDSRVTTIARRVIQSFQRATRLMDCQVKFLEIPYQQHKLPGYLYLPPINKRLKGKIPILLNTGGADSIQEELYYVYGASGPNLGYAVVTFEGPGQGIVLREQKLHMRPDWEVVVGNVLDHLNEISERHPELELDLDRVAITGASMGAYYALRAAADPRIKACVSIDPFYDMFDFATAHSPQALIEGWSRGWISDGFVDTLFACLTHLDFQTKWELDLTSWFFGVERPSQILKEMKKYTLRELSLQGKTSFLKNVHCPVLVSGAAHSLYLDATHTMQVYYNLSNQNESNKKVWIPEAPGDGGLQAKVGAFGISTLKTFEFLDKIFDINRTNSN